MTEIYLHIDARMHGRLYPHAPVPTISGPDLSNRFWRQQEWAAIAAATVASVSAWNAFHATNRKMARYSNTVEKCASIKLCWEQLAPVDKANVARYGNVEPCMTEIYLHIDARMADYIHTHP